MRLTTKLSAFLTLLTGLAIFVTLIGCSLSFYNAVNNKIEQRLNIMATMVDEVMLSTSPDKLTRRLEGILQPLDIKRLKLITATGTLYEIHLPESYLPSGVVFHYRTQQIPLLKHPGVTLQVSWRDPFANYFQSLFTTVPLTIAFGFMLVMLFISVRWIRLQLQGQELLENRSIRILNGERGASVRGSVHEWPTRASSALDVLLADLQDAGEQRSRVDTLIRAFAAQDAKTGLHNRLFFDNQLATLLEDHENVGSHGVVMMIRLPDFDILRETWGANLVEEYLFSLVNMLSTFTMRYPGALLARYFRSDFAVLLPHRTLKEADTIASQLLKAVDSLPPTRMLDRHDMLHIGICAWQSGQTTQQVMEHAELATRNAVLQGSNSWAVYDNELPEKGRGSVKWRTLIENALQRGGPRLYQKPAVTHQGNVHHRELFCRIFDGEQEVLAAEYMPFVQQLGLSERYDRQLVARIIPLTRIWPEERLAIPVNVDSLLRRSFLRWLRDALMECEKSQRQRIIFELAEEDVCQHLSRLQPAVRLIKALGAQVAVTQAGLKIVSTTYIKDLDIELIKIHAGLVRNIEHRTENQLFVQSLAEACHVTGAQIFATGVRTRSEWQTLVSKGVEGGQGDFFAPSQPLDSNVKKYSQRYPV